MRKFRCPHCGEKTITVFDRVAARSNDYNRPFRPTVTFCKDCNGWSRSLPKTRKLISFRILALVLTLAAMIVSWFVFTTAMAYVCCGALLLGFIIYNVIDLLYEPLIPVVLDEGVSKAFSWKVPDRNAVFTVNDSKDIKPYFVYGVKFEAKTENQRFKERFTDGLVPVVFHERRKGSNVFEVRIIGKKFVPEELLHIGSEFLVEDNDQFICRGTVSQIFKDIE